MSDLPGQYTFTFFHRNMVEKGKLSTFISQGIMELLKKIAQEGISKCQYYQIPKHMT